MISIKWIKLDTGIFEDEKIKIVLAMPEGKTLLIIWLKLLCLAGRINNSGVLMVNKTIPYTLEMLSAVFGEQEQMMRLAVDTFERLGMVEAYNGALCLPNWEKHQAEDALEKIRSDTCKRVAKHRATQRLLAGDSNVTVTLQKRDSNTDVTQQTKTKTQTKTIESSAKTKNIPPTLDDVTAYCKERNNGIDPARFIDYYETRGWMVGKSKMKDWGAAIRTWETNDKKTAEQQPKERKIKMLN